MALSWVNGPAYVYYVHLIRILKTNRQFRRSYIGIARQITWSALGTGIGGFFGGPLGATVGGFVGTVIGYCTSDDYSSMIRAIQTLSEAEKQRLVHEVQSVVGEATQDALNNFVSNRENIRQLINFVKFFLENRG